MLSGCCDDVIMSSDVMSDFGGVVDRLHWCMLFFHGIEHVSFFIRSYLPVSWMLCVTAFFLSWSKFLL